MRRLESLPDERAYQARLAHSGRAGYADDRGVARARIELSHERVCDRIAVFHRGNLVDARGAADWDAQSLMTAATVGRSANPSEN
jgi:hypothetical protein